MALVGRIANASGEMYVRSRTDLYQSRLTHTPYHLTCLHSAALSQTIDRSDMDQSDIYRSGPA
jgi:hypothetical protein